MNFPKTEMYNLIKRVKIEGQTIEYTQGMPEEFKTLPVISYSSCINNPNYSLKNTLAKETVSVQIDIWSNGSSINTFILKALTDVMLENKWQLVTAQDMDRNDGVYRIMTKFIKVM